MASSRSAWEVERVPNSPLSIVHAGVEESSCSTSAEIVGATVPLSVAWTLWTARPCLALALVSVSVLPVVISSWTALSCSLRRRTLSVSSSSLACSSASLSLWAFSRSSTARRESACAAMARSSLPCARLRRIASGAGSLASRHWASAPSRAAHAASIAGWSEAKPCCRSRRTTATSSIHACRRSSAQGGAASPSASAVSSAAVASAPPVVWSLTWPVASPASWPLSSRALAVAAAATLFLRHALPLSLTVWNPSSSVSASRD